MTQLVIAGIDYKSLIPWCGRKAPPRLLRFPFALSAGFHIAILLDTLTAYTGHSK